MKKIHAEAAILKIQYGGSLQGQIDGEFHVRVLDPTKKLSAKFRLYVIFFQQMPFFSLIRVDYLAWCKNQGKMAE